jgi:hypothetical protein
MPLWVANAPALQAAADALSAKLIRPRLDYWTLLVGPKFSKQDRQAINLGRHYSLQQVEYCRNLIFRRNFPIHKLFERSCDLGLLRLSADRIVQVFGWRLHKRIAGKLSSVLERTDHGHHVLRAYAKNAVMRMYEKFVCCESFIGDGDGPPKSVCRGRLQTATSCQGKEPWW